MNIPNVSVIVPVYNGMETVSCSLQSLFVQSLHDIEIIAVNDASTDRTAEILDRLAAEEPRLRVIHLNTNVGVHEARAAGLKMAKASFIGFMDADDFVDPEMFMIMLKESVQQDADISICGIDLCSNEHKKIGIKVAFDFDKTETSDAFINFCNFKYGTGSLCNKLYKRDLVLKHALKKLKWRQDASEDTIINIGCFHQAKRIRLVKARLYRYVVNPGSATRKFDTPTYFTRMFRAYATAVDTYHGYGREALDEITKLYARQLQFSSYRVRDREALVPHEPHLVEAVEVLARKYPLGLALLANNGWIETKQNKYQFLLSLLSRMTRKFIRH